jgi:hypothetical protein
MVRGFRFSPLRRMAMAGAPLALLLAAACDPCFGTAGCGSRSLRFDGRVQSRYEGTPLEGVQVTVLPTSGASAGDTLTAVSDAQGRFSVDAPAGTDVVTADVILRPRSPFVADTLRGVELRAAQGGDVLGLVWTVTRPYVATLFTFYRRGDNAPLAPNGFVQFQRTGGPATSPDLFGANISAEGKAWITPVASDTGTVVGTLVVQPVTGAPLRREGVRLPVVLSPVAGSEQRVGFGPSLSYFGRVATADGRVVPGAVVQFRQTGGVPSTPATWSVTTDAGGNFAFQMHAVDPLQAGEVVGDLTVTPPAPFAPTVARGLRLPTFDTDEFRFVSTWIVTPAP